MTPASFQKYKNLDPTSLLARAFRFSQRAHEGQKRKSGEAYFLHTLETAEILFRWKLDEPTIVAGLLHDILEDTSVTPEELEREFGKEISFLVQGVTKLGRLKYRGDEAKVENMRKLILALSQDLRVVFIKLADRLHNMRTIRHLPPQKQKRIALETNEIYAVIAYRLGMHEVAGELHDYAFPILYPKEEEWIKEKLSDAYEVRKKYLKQFEPQLKDVLMRAKISPLSTDFRAKHHYSLYRKLLRYDMDISKIYDLVALRIIFSTVEECYAALGAIHGVFLPLPGRIKDYIAIPKASSYRSLHTTVIGPNEKYIEIQIRTKKMHEENEYGIAAHWLYKKELLKEKHSDPIKKRITDALSWVTHLKEWHERYETAKSDPSKFMHAMKTEFFKNRIFAITPRGDVLDLPLGSTPIDFAYHVHTDIGNSCVGAKVNGNITPLNYKLMSGDIVEILTQKNKRPSENWLKLVHTQSAREHIRNALREKQNRFIAHHTPSKTELRIAVHDRIGLIKDISSIIARSHINIIGFHTHHTPGSHYPINKTTIATTDKKKIEKLILKLKNLKEIKEINYRIL